MVLESFGVLYRFAVIVRNQVLGTACSDLQWHPEQSVHGYMYYFCRIGSFNALRIGAQRRPSRYLGRSPKEKGLLSLDIPTTHPACRSLLTEYTYYLA